MMSRGTQQRGHYKQWWAGLLAIVPFYQPSNDRTGVVVYYQNGVRECIADCSCRHVLTQLAVYLGTSLPQMQARAAAEGYQRKGPLVFHGRLCLVPVKFREQKRKNNGTLGYINAQAVARIFQNDDGSSVLYFQDNSISLIALQRKATVQRHVQQGLSLLAGYGEQVAPEQMQAVGAVYPWEQGFGQTIKHGVMDGQ